MKFEEKTSLARAMTGPEGGTEYESLEDGETLLVCWKSLCQFTDRVRQEGYWLNNLYPCYYNGKKSFLQESIWQPNEGYSPNHSKIEKILTHHVGFRMMEKRGTFDWMFQKD